GTLLWTANFEAASIVGDIRSIALSSDQLEFGIVISNINHLRLLSVATATGVLNSNMPIASYVGNQYYATHIPLHATSQGYFVSWQYSTTSSFPIPYDTFIQKMFSANYGPYQVTGVLSPGIDVLAYGIYSIKDG